MSKINTLQDLYVSELRDMYNAENQILKALPRMAKAVSNEELRQAFMDHIEQTETHVDRLEQVFDMLGVKVRGKKCLAMEGIIDEGKELLSEEISDDALDAALIAAAQKVEHYEIATYGTLRVWARELGFEDQAVLLEQTLNEEKTTDLHLTELAESIVNIEAENGDAVSSSHFGSFASNGTHNTNGSGRSKK